MEILIFLLKSLLQHWSWVEKPFAQGQALVDLVSQCLTGKTKVIFRNKFYELERYQIITSDNILTERWGWKRARVRTFLQILEDDKLIIMRRDKRKTIITLCIEAASADEVLIELTSYLSFPPQENTEEGFHVSAKESKQQDELVIPHQTITEHQQQNRQQKCPSSEGIEQNSEHEDRNKKEHEHVNEIIQEKALKNNNKNRNKMRKSNNSGPLKDACNLKLNFDEQQNNVIINNNKN